MTDQDPAFSVIVPCYNEVGAIADTVAAIRAALADGAPYELIIVDDGSTDGTLEAIERIKRTDADLVVLRHERNLGYGAALKSGIRHASAPLVAITDADGTYPVEKLPQLIAECAEADMVVGARIGADVIYSGLRAIPKLFLRRWVGWLAGREIPDFNSGMRAFKRDLALKFFGILPNTFSFTTTITLAMVTNFYDVRFMPIGYKLRVGKSKIQPIRDTLRFCTLIMRTGTYFAPLRAIMPLAAMLFTAGLGSLAHDVFILVDLTEATLLLFLFSLNIGMFALLADMIDRRMPR